MPRARTIVPFYGKKEASLRREMEEAARYGDHEHATGCREEIDDRMASRARLLRERSGRSRRYVPEERPTGNRFRNNTRSRD